MPKPPSILGLIEERRITMMNINHLICTSIIIGSVMGGCASSGRVMNGEHPSKGTATNTITTASPSPDPSKWRPVVTSNFRLSVPDDMRQIDRKGTDSLVML